MMRYLVSVLRLLLGLLLLSGVAATSAAAARGGAGHTVTMTTTIKETNPIYDAINPCAPADSLVGVSRDNIVFHELFFPETGAFRATATVTSKIMLTDQATGVVYTGHSIQRKGFRQNARSSNDSFAVTMIVKGSDGSTIHSHQSGHITVNAHGRITVSFDRDRVTCG